MIHQSRRMLWRCRRGMRELDVLLESYFRNRYDDAPDAEQQAFRQLLDLPDDQLSGFVVGTLYPEDPHLRQILAAIRSPAAG